MSKFDATAVAQLALRLGLITESQLREAIASIGVKNPAPELLCLAFQSKNQLTPWQSQKLLKGDREGYFLGGYRIRYRIASGSFGRVFRADEPQTGTVVAIKVLRDRWSKRSRAVDLFEREGKVGMSLDHPNIVKILEVGLERAARQYYIVMEFVEGGNLRDLLAIRKKFEPTEAIHIVENTASALAYAQSMGVTHRDIKLTNILISAGGQAKLVDFGLADICTDSSVEANDEAKAYRTVDYSGLEQATGVAPGDTRSDIFFLGCVFYEMLTGKPALALAANVDARRHKERFLNVPVLRADEVTAPASLFQLVEKMCALNPVQRFQTPSQLLEAVRDVRRDMDANAPAHAPPPPDRSVFLVERNRHLQETLRAHLKKEGYRVRLAVDAALAKDGYRHDPYDALILDAGTVGVDAIRVFEEVLNEARHRGRLCLGILILSVDQSSWAKAVPPGNNVVALVRPVTLGQLIHKLREHVPTTRAQANNGNGTVEASGL
jgi:serine/threonine protein kinase